MVLADSWLQEVPCRANLSVVRNQGKSRSKHLRLNGLVASSCDHGLPAGFADILIGEAFAIVQYAQRIHLRQKNSPPYPRAFQWLRVQSYDAYCSWIVNQLNRLRELFPEETWLHELVQKMEGQIPASHIGGHGKRCNKMYQPAYFPCRAHFHGETAEHVWPYLNPFGPSLRQMNAGARHDNINFAIDAWNRKKLLRMSDQLGDEREEALHVASQNVALFRQLSEKHKDKVGSWSRQSRKIEERKGEIHSVYHHNFQTAATIDDVLDSLKNNSAKTDHSVNQTTVAEWICWGIELERAQLEIHAYLKAQQDHPMQETWDTIVRLRDSLNEELSCFRPRQAALWPQLELSALDVNQPEDTVIQLPSRLLGGKSLFTVDAASMEQEVLLRCAQANSQILAVREKTITLSIVRGSREFDYRGQRGVTRAQRSQQHASLLRDLEIIVYNAARNALTALKCAEADAFPHMSLSDTVRKDTHVFRMRGDSRIVNGTMWDLRMGGIDATDVLGEISGRNTADSDSDSDSDDKVDPALP
ncbi:hypothetical protein GGX14DRAFT_408420 [Mycena pura]|uniref:Uncharacterized protein n=1 Tax=Mycena pura TaxID=153505 RepID=A0AAD6UQA1_9AGAR|nr:hypothetical protein GGX14DRAFT_408420 [Mycena pura]